MINSYIVTVYRPFQDDAIPYPADVWNRSKDNPVGTYNIRIPNYSGDIASLINSGLFGSRMVQYLLGTVTENFEKLNNAIPFGYYNFPRVTYTSPPLSASYVGERFFICNSINDLIDLENLDLSKKYFFVMANENSEYYLLYRLSGGGYVEILDEYRPELFCYGIFSKTSNTYVADGSHLGFGVSGTFPVGFDYYFQQGYLFSYGNGSLYYFAVTGDDYYANYLRTRWNEHGYLNANITAYLKNVLGEPFVIDPENPYDPIPQPDPTPEVPVVPGAFDFHSDPVTPPTLPSISAAATGFTRLFNPTLSELNMLADYMWTDNTFLQTLLNHVKQIVEDPMKYIISLQLVPCQPQTSNAVSVKLLYIDTGVSMPPITNQFVSVDCGTYTVVRNYNSALDFAPNTKASLYLPYIGVVPLDVDEIMPSPPDDETVIGVKYVIDVFGGSCVAMVTVNGDVKYQFSGHCSINIPFSSADFSSYQSALIQAAKTVVGAAAAASGAENIGAALLGAPVQKTSDGEVERVSINAEGDVTGASSTTRSSSTKAQFGSLVANNISNTVSQVAASKPSVERSAGFSGNTGYMAVRRPYLLFESPRLVNPTEYGKYNGYPTMLYESFANLSGFTQVQQIQLVGFSGTNPEIDELQALLKSGVIF